MKKKITLGILGLILLYIGITFIFAIPVYFLWNALMPDIFNLKQITFSQALGLTFLTRLLFGQVDLKYNVNN